MGEKGERSKKLQNSHRGVKYSIENITNNIVITTHGARWVTELPGDHLINYVIV